MFKRLFLLSGVIAFVLASLTMWFWYMPNHPEGAIEVERMNQEGVDTVLVDEPAEILE